MQSAKTILSIIELIVLLYLYFKLGSNQSKLFSHKIGIAGLVIVQILYSLSLSFISFSIRPIITTTYPLIIGFYINKYIFRNSHIISVINVLTVAFMLIISQLIVVFFLMMLGIADLTNNYIYVVGQIGYLSLMMLIYVLFRHKIAYYSKQISEFLRIKGLGTLFRLLPYALLLGILIYFIVQMIYTRNFRESLMNFWWLATFLIILALFSIVNITQAELKNKTLENKLMIQQEKTQQLEAYEIIMSEVKGFWHNYSNIIQILIMALESDELVNPELKNAVEEYVEEDMSEIRDSIEITKINNPILFAAVTVAAKKAKEIGVNLEIESFGQSIANINSKELSEIISVLLDNAIEVAFFADKIVNIEINLEDQVTIAIQNRYVEEAGIVKKYGLSNNIGIETVEKIIQKYNNASYNVEKSAGIYTAKIVIN